MLRILLLILMVALFVAIWSNDRPAALQGHAETQWATSPSQPDGSARRAGLCPVEAAAQTAPVVVLPTGSEPAATPPQQAMMVKPIVGLPLRRADVPLPNDLPAGEYRVVSSEGRVWTLAVPAAASRESRPMPELCTLTADGVRWYFIRLENTEPVVPAPPQDAHPLTALLPEWNCPRLLDEVLARCRCDFGMLCDGSCRWCDKGRRRFEARLRQAEAWMGSFWILVQQRMAAGGEATSWE
ncbi:MAG: hypothetical protein ACREJB_13685 [Planctomycetaceae bacterium]